MDRRELVSVVVPTFNRAHSILGSLASVCAQTYSTIELIVVDDGSSDDTAAVVAGVQDQRVRYLRLAENRGQSAARNVGLRASTGRLVAFQDSDDVWVPEKLAKQVAVLSKHAELAGVYCDLDRRQLDGRSLVIEAPRLETGRYLDHRGTLYQTYGLGIQSCLFKREVLFEVGGFREDLRCFEDLEMLLRIANKYPLKRIEEALVLYNETPGSVSNQISFERQARIHLLRRYGLRGFARHPLNVLSEITRCFGGQQLLSNGRKAACRFIRGTF